MSCLRVLIGALALATLASEARAQAPPGASTPVSPLPVRVEPGSKFPPMKLQALLPGEKALRPWDLGASVGVRPVVIFYFLLDESLSVKGFLEMQAFAAEQLKGKVDLFGAARLGRSVTLSTAAGKLAGLGVRVPVILEVDLDLGTALGVTSAPGISLIDASGVLRITDARSLKQQVASGFTLSQAILSAARGGPVPTVAKLARYYPANEMVGERFQDFTLKTFSGAERIKLSDVVARAGREKKITALYFWHPNCKRCKQAMPGIVAGYNTYRKYLDIISLTHNKSADEARNCEDTIQAHRMTFPVLQDEDGRVSDLYKVLSTPTMFFLRPDGVVESVYTRGDVNYVPVFSAKLRSILGVASQLRGNRPGG